MNDHSKRLMGSLILAAVACAVCVGISFVLQLLGNQQTATPSPTSTSVSAPPFDPTPWEAS